MPPAHHNHCGNRACHIPVLAYKNRMRGGLQTGILLLVLIITFTNTHAQVELDSLRLIMNSGSSYRERIKAYQAFGDKYALHDFDETLDIIPNGISLALKEHDAVRVGILKRYLGMAHYFKGNYDTAARYFYESVNVLEAAQETKNLALVYNDLAKLYRKTRDLRRAGETYDKALTLFNNLKDSAGISMIQNESGVVFEYMKNYAEAIRRYTASYNIDRALNNPMGVSYALSNLAGVYTLQQKFAEGEKYLQEALELRRHLRDSLALAIIYSDVAANYLSQKKYKLARRYTDSSNNIATLMNYPELQTSNYKIRSEISRQTGDFEQAFFFLDKRTAIHDSLMDKEKLKQIEELSAKYETLKKEKIIEQQKFQIAQRNYWIIAGVIIMMLIIYTSVSLYKRGKLQQQARLQHEVLYQQRLATKAILAAEEKERQRIAKDLHDGVGQMMSAAKMNLSALENNIGFSTSKEQLAYKAIITLVDDSCNEVRSVSHSMMPNALLKNNLAEALRTFSNQLNRPGLRIDLYTEGLEEKLDDDIETVLYRVIQECVNNVVKHAEATAVDISVIRDAEGISATIEDNGIGFRLNGSAPTDGIGMKNIRSRIQYLAGTVEFNSSPGSGTLVSLFIPKGFQ